MGSKVSPIEYITGVTHMFTVLHTDACSRLDGEAAPTWDIHSPTARLASLDLRLLMILEKEEREYSGTTLEAK